MNDKSMLEVATEIMASSNEPKNIYKLIDEVMEQLGLGDDANLKAQLYIDITTSADFVFCGGEDSLWDLKTRQSLDVWDKKFYETDIEDDVVDDDEEDEDLSLEDYNYVEDEDEESDEESDEDEDEDEDSTYEIDESLGDEDEEDEENSWDDEDEENSWDDEDEEKYNDMMDDYEDLYEDK